MFNYRNLRKSKKSDLYNDIAFKILAQPTDTLFNELNEDFELKVSPEDYLFKFEHIAQTGGSNINDLLKRTLKEQQFWIPSYSEVWAEPRTPKVYESNPLLKVLSAHYLNGTQINSTKKIKSFTFIRDPRKIIMSSIQSGEKNRLGVLEFWRLTEKKLIEIRKDFGHLNYQLYELAIKNSKKKFPYVHGGPAPIFNPENLQGTKPAVLVELVGERLETDLAFIGVTENFSESALLLFEILGISKLKLWRPGLFSYRKYSFEEAPQYIQELIEDLCKDELEFYKKCKDVVINLANRSPNFKVLPTYIEQNKRSDLKFIQSIQEKLELATANNDEIGLRLKGDLEFVKSIILELEKTFQIYNSM